MDKEAAHIDHLQKILNERGYRIDDDRIAIRTGRFESKIGEVLDSIRQRQPRSGRAVFLLDQTGFSQVALPLVSRIFRELPTAEVILTFAAEALVNHLAETPQIAKAVAPLQMTESQIHDLIQFRNGDGGRALVQRTLRNQARKITGATYDTPFFIRPERSRRALWFLHLSRHPTARDVMIQQHWDIRNTFEHYGPGDFGMLGWDALSDSNILPLFQFEDVDCQQMHFQLLGSLPSEIFRLVSEGPITIDAFRHALANRTAARFRDLDQVVLQLCQDREFEILNPEGGVRSRLLQRLRSTDQIAVPSNRLLPALSRL